MKLVIDIPEKVYTCIQREWKEYDFDSVVNHALNGIKNGTPLKCYGKLIDADKIIHEMDEMKVQGETFTTAVNFARILMRVAPTIIEADIESEK